MAEALRQAERGLYTTMPNPRVGCVIVRADGRVTATGWHFRAGEPHAEVHALRIAGGSAQGGTVYLTLEPCSHHGRTPPCCEALSAAGVARVVIAMADPNPLVAGRGIEHLRAAGIQVDVGLMQEQARALNLGFISRMERQRPWVRLKLASSLDGHTAMASGESKWLTGVAARCDVQRLRARSCAIVSGVDTILADNAALNVRADELGLENADEIARRQPIRVVLDSTLRLRPPARVFAGWGRVVIATASEDERKRQHLIDQGAEVLTLPRTESGLDLHLLLAWLHEQQCNEVMVEAGARLAGSFWRAGLVDWLTLYMAPTLLGSEGRPLLDLPLVQMREQQRLDIRDWRAIGQDWRIDAVPINSSRAT